MMLPVEKIFFLKTLQRNLLKHEKTKLLDFVSLQVIMSQLNETSTCRVPSIYHGLCSDAGNTKLNELCHQDVHYLVKDA